MGKHSEILRAVKAREAGERVRQAKSEATKSVSSPLQASSTMAMQAHTKRSMSFSGFCIKAILAMVLTLGTVYGANEVMQLLLK